MIDMAFLIAITCFYYFFISHMCANCAQYLPNRYFLLVSYRVVQGTPGPDLPTTVDRTDCFAGWRRISFSKNQDWRVGYWISSSQI